MAYQLFDDLISRVSTFVHGFNFSEIAGYTDVPDRLIVRPVDVWEGDARRGSLLFDGIFCKDDEQLSLNVCGWEPKDVDESWISHIHGFTWLRDLRVFAKDGGPARGQASAMAWMMILAWIDNYNHNKATRSLFYRPDIAGERLSMWISMFEFFCPERFDAAGDEEFHDAFFEAVLRHGQYLARYVGVHLQARLFGIDALKAAKGLLYAGLSIEGCEDWRDQALARLKVEVDTQILSDGAHVSRSPVQLLEALQILLDVRGAMSSAGQRLPDFVQHAIDRIGPALRFYRYNDRRFGVFHGAQQGDADFIDSVMAQTGVRGKALESLPCAGFERVSKGRTLLVFDCGEPSRAPHDKSAHASPLSFEMSYTKQRIFVNCGTHYGDIDWRNALRRGPAHNTLTIDGHDPVSFTRDGRVDRKPVHMRSMREENKQSCLLEASHDGFVSLNGYTHTRRIYIGDDGSDLRGDDCLESLQPLDQPLDVCIRFHLDPNVTISLINNGAEALLRLPGGVGWRFKHHGGTLSMEDSVYMGDGGIPRKTKQLVINGQVFDIYHQFKWCLRKEG